MSDEMKQCYDAYSQKIYVYMLSLCGNHETAQDIMQETFYQAIRHIDDYRRDCSMYTWLCSIAKNLWLKEVRRQKYHPVVEDKGNGTSLCRSPEEHAETKETLLSVMKKIHTLPEQEKEIVLMRAAGELSFREIGEIFGKSENWARVTYYRAKVKLKEELK